uniref:Uncharacterized protein n=1 Tax=Chromera velia CCMP2878 TaxID=1169474 RepID=A0A0G4H4Z6_9ALVE|eukprot:Cvel_24658.t1-p1 / transcript=Cvel_24658.t1 / gene=Cvel_24658 / organism=Chromera_velia_CCMP2878 / gene_product=hypothetical protein / transcript_product=hypothetical protein / location=Cvel_scaffold2696:3076-3645(-) / protein_length=190 / sequence_SO=supercontig / SO=protein_coding / is_pseudo=false
MFEAQIAFQNRSRLKIKTLSMDIYQEVTLAAGNQTTHYGFRIGGNAMEEEDLLKVFGSQAAKQERKLRSTSTFSFLQSLQENLDTNRAGNFQIQVDPKAYQSYSGRLIRVTSTAVIRLVTPMCMKDPVVQIPLTVCCLSPPTLPPPKPVSSHEILPAGWAPSNVSAGSSSLSLAAAPTAPSSPRPQTAQP